MVFSSPLWDYIVAGMCGAIAYAAATAVLQRWF